MFIRKNKITPEKKKAAVNKALEWYDAGHTQKAVELYKKYGISDAEFGQCLAKHKPVNVVDATDAQKAAACRKALEWYDSGHRQEAYKLCRKYGVTDAEFTQVLLAHSRDKVASFSPTPQQIAAIKKALDWWTQGHPSKALELCKKYHVPEAALNEAVIARARGKI